MNKQLQVFLAGLIVVVPFAITVYVFWSLATWLGGLGYSLVEKFGAIHGPKPTQAEQHVAAVVGGVLVIGSVYVTGLLTRVLVFRKLLGWVERIVGRLPGAKTIYESVRDLMKLFGGDSKKMGRAVLYQIPGSDTKVLGILTNDRPTSAVRSSGESRVAVYLPLSYMLGGLTIYVPPDHVREINLSVDQVLKLCATAHVSGGASVEPKDADAGGQVAGES